LSNPRYDAGVKAPILFLLAASVAASSFSATALPATARNAVESPHATMSELGREFHAPIPRNEKHEQRRSFAPKTAVIAAKTAVHSESIVTIPTLSAPPVKAGFAGTHDRGSIPSDAAGDVSAKYLLHVSNASVLAQDRTGAVLSNITLASFWHDVSYPDGSVYDSRVSYDAAADRWIICTLYDVNLKKATLLIAVSDGGNPSLGWHRYRYIVDPVFDILEADFTRMAMTRDSIVITANIFDSSFQYAEVFTFRKSDAYASSSTLPIAASGRTFEFDLVPVDGRADATIYMVALLHAFDLSLYTYSGSGLTHIVNLEAPLPNLGSDFPLPIGLQLGSALKLDCGFIFTTNAVLKNGVLWVASQPYRDSPFRSSVLWWRIVLGSPVRVDTGLIDDPTGATMYAYPSIAVNKLGAALIGYAVFKASLYPAAGYSYIDPSNSLSTPALLKTGDGPSHIDRWADFSTTVTDANDIDFWTIQTYAPTFIAANGYWATWWAKIEMPAPARRRAALH
jgi:hypothetical protein